MGGKVSAESRKKYQDRVYDRLSVVLPKGQKAEIQQAAQAEGKSVNAWIAEAIDNKIRK